jgi:hypothetical protein
VSDPNPPQGFNWNVPPKKPEDAADPQATNPPAPAQQPPVAPPAWPTQPPAAAAPPAAAPPAWPTQPPAAAAPPAWPTQPPAAAAPPQWPAAQQTQPPVQPAPPVYPAQQTQPPAQAPTYPPAAAPPPTWPPAAQTAPPPAFPAQQQPAPPAAAAPPAWPGTPQTTPPAPQTTPPAPQPAPPPLVQPTVPPTASSPSFPTGSYGFPSTEAFAPPQPTQPPVPQRPNYEDVPTQAIAYDPFATQAYPFDGALSGATEVLGAQPVGLPELRDESLRPPGQSSAIDSLFGESQFKEYEAGALPIEGFSGLASNRPRQERTPLGKPQKVLLWVAGGLLAALALVGLFLLGTKLPGLLPAAPEAIETPAPVGPVDARPVVVGPVAAGEHAWGTLLGSECIDPYLSAWQETYTVVDCAAPHTAQLVYHGYFADEAWAPYPGQPTLQSRINLLCTSPVSVNYSVASQFSDIQISASYASNEEQWDAGQRDYYCFVSRSSGEQLTTSVANTPVAAEGLTATIPSNDP